MINFRGGGGRVVVPPPTGVRTTTVARPQPAPIHVSAPVVTTVVSHQAILQYPIYNPSLSANQKIVVDFADVIGTPPVSMGQDYLDQCVRVAALLGVPSAAAQNTLRSIQVSPVQEVQPLLSISRALTFALGSIVPYGSIFNPVYSLAAENTNNTVSIRNAALSARNNVFDFINRVSSFIGRASNAGLQPPDNPFVVISNLEAARRARAQQTGNSGLGIDVPSNEADDLVFNIGAYVELLTAEQQGKLNLDRVTNVAAQLNSFTLSMDGYGSGGNVATDLMRFLPSADEVRAQKDLDLLAAFDFRKRIPKVIFTADYDPSGDPNGMVIGWKKIPDASGYIIKRRNIFDSTEKTVQVSNTDLTTAMDHLRDYLKAYVLSFYDTIDDTHVWAYLDQSTTPDQYYLYTVQAYQVHNDAKDQMFNTPTNPTSFSSVNRNKLTTTLRNLAQQYFGKSAGSDDINPWPLISLQLYGNSQFDWILAAVNSRASVNRNDSVADTRRFSYLGARLSHILEFMDRGIFVAPKDVNAVVRNVSTSITQFGVSQSIAEILHETGILYYFEGTEQKKPSGFNRAGSLNVTASPLLSGIIAAVDPETATLDLKSLGTNLPQILNNTKFSNDPSEITGLKMGKSGGNPNVHATPQEINVPDPNKPTDTIAQGDIQYLNELPATADSVIDLTTFDGLSKLTRTIRLFADEGPHRGGGDDIESGIFQPAPHPSAIYVPPPPPATIYVPPSRVSGIAVSPPPPATREKVQAPIVVRRTLINKLIE